MIYSLIIETNISLIKNIQMLDFFRDLEKIESFLSGTIKLMAQVLSVLSGETSVEEFLINFCDKFVK